MTSIIPKEKKELIKNLKVSCDALLDKKAEDIRLLYFGEKSSLISDIKKEIFSSNISKDLLDFVFSLINKVITILLTKNRLAVQ